MYFIFQLAVAPKGLQAQHSKGYEGGRKIAQNHLRLKYKNEEAYFPLKA